MFVTTLLSCLNNIVDNDVHAGQHNQGACCCALCCYKRTEHNAVQAY